MAQLTGNGYLIHEKSAFRYSECSLTAMDVSTFMVAPLPSTSNQVYFVFNMVSLNCIGWLWTYKLPRMALTFGPTALACLAARITMYKVPAPFCFPCTGYVLAWHVPFSEKVFYLLLLVCRCVRVREQLLGVGSFLPQWVFEIEFRSSVQQWQVILLIEPSCWPSTSRFSARVSILKACGNSMGPHWDL